MPRILTAAEAGGERRRYSECMRILYATFVVLLGLFFLAAAVAAVVRIHSFGSFIAAALMAIVGVTTIRVAGSILQRAD